jgi:uncharacterized membrane protein YjjP (DUF1212 family)
MATRTEVAADPAEVQRLLLDLGVALTETGDAVSEIQTRLGSIAAAYGYPQAHVSVFPTVLFVALEAGEPAGARTIDSSTRLRLDQASEVIHLARSAGGGEVEAPDARASLGGILAAPARFGVLAYIVAHAVMTVGLALVIRPATVDLWVYAALGLLVGGLKAGSNRLGMGGYLLPVFAATLVSAIAFLAHGGNDAASLRLTIPPLVSFLPGALLTMGTVDLAMGDTVTGASRFVAGLIQLTLLAIGIVVGAQLVGNPHSGPTAGSGETLGAWAPWAGVALFGLGVFVHDSAPRRSLPWLLVVLFAAWIGQLAGQHIIDATLSGFIGAAVMVPIAHLVARVPSAPPAHVMFLPGFWLLVPGTIGLIGVTELFSDNSKWGVENLSSALVATPSVALGILVGTIVVRVFTRSG